MTAMTNLWIRIPGADPSTRTTATRALIDAGLKVDHAWLGETDPDLIRAVDQHLANRPRRDPFGVALGAVTVALGAAVVAWMISLGGWWLLVGAPAGAVGLVGLVGMVSDLQKRPRSK